MKPENVVELPAPDPSLVGEGKFDLGNLGEPPEPVRNWQDTLAKIEYDPTFIEITKVEITGVIGKQLAGERWKTLHSAPDLPEGREGVSVELPDEALREAIKEVVLQMAEELTVGAGYASAFKGEVYSALMAHIRNKFLGGVSLGLAERADLAFAWKMLPQVKKTVAAIPGLVAGIVENANQ